MKRTQISGYLRDFTWINKYLKTESKQKSIKQCMLRRDIKLGPRADTTRTEQIRQ